MKENRFILTCSCPGTPKFAEEAYRILFPEEQPPKIYTGENNIYYLANQFPDTNFGRYAKGLAKNRDKFAYYFEINEKGDVVSQINLKSGLKLI